MVSCDSIGPVDRSPSPPFHLDRVRVERDGRAVLNDVTLDLGDAPVTALVGPSGSGKSTLLRLLNRLIAPTSGRVLLHGRDLAELGSLALRRHVGLVMQRPVPFPGTVADNIRVAAPTATDAEVTTLLDRVGLSPQFAERVADELSGGEAQRMVIARALAVGPELLLADEPTSSLDGDATARVEALLRELADAGTHVIIATHDLGQVDRLSAVAIHVRDGTAERA